ncbi:hypothetical protein [Streptomyces sp. NPDC059788]|uniref:hypothetical protein n=1 Tax=Streptomyces sp. NPDC059788 TaxID=3346948 RepID=UPI00364A9C71
MPSITVDLSGGELAELRAEAQRLGVPVERLAHGIVCESVARGRRQRRTAESRARIGAVGSFEAALRPSDGKET